MLTGWQFNYIIKPMICLNTLWNRLVAFLLLQMFLLFVFTVLLAAFVVHVHGVVGAVVGDNDAVAVADALVAAAVVVFAHLPVLVLSSLIWSLLLILSLLVLLVVLLIMFN